MSLAQLFLLCALLTVVIHSFVADSSLLDCCDLVVFCFVCFFAVGVCVFFHLMLAGRQVWGRQVWGFEVVSAVLFLSFGVSCLLARLGQPFFVTAFSALGIRVRLFVFALLVLVQCISVSQHFWYHAVRLLFVSFILGDSNLIFFHVGYSVDSPTNSALKQTPFDIPP